MLSLLESAITFLMLALIVGTAVWMGTRPNGMWLLIGLAVVLALGMITLVLVV